VLSPEERGTLRNGIKQARTAYKNRTDAREALRRVADETARLLGGGDRRDREEDGIVVE
jgi:hypothetical protein